MATRRGKRRQRWVEDREYGEMLGRMVDAYGRRLNQADAGDLPQLAALRDKIDAVLVEAVASMRERGVTWGEIGEAFGMTRQAAQQRWGSQPRTSRKSAASSARDRGRASGPG